VIPPGDEQPTAQSIAQKDLTMSVSASQSGSEPPREDVLTLAEAAAYLRVEGAAVEQLLADQAIPTRKIGGEWRFLRRALEDWLRFPGRHPRDYWTVLPHVMLEAPFVEELIHLLEERVLQKLRQAAPAPPRPGSKHAVLKHSGIFREDNRPSSR
jgi:excisionase family DNA binding protein